MTCTSPVLINPYKDEMTPRSKRLYDGSNKEYGMYVPCGKCLNCRISRRREWKTRIMHELHFHKESCFITLTYNDENICWAWRPFQAAMPTLFKRDVQLFLKRLRKYIEPVQIKYYACGEYGDQTGRPHYHLIILGWQPDLKDLYIPNGKDRVSRTIERLWPYGNNTVGTVTPYSAQYVSGYITDKLTGELAKAKYGAAESPFQLCSLGLGLRYALEYGKQVIDNLSVTMFGANVGIPRYYKRKLGLDQSNPRLVSKAKETEAKEREWLEKKGLNANEIVGYQYSARQQRDKDSKKLLTLKKKML